MWAILLYNLSKPIYTKSRRISLHLLDGDKKRKEKVKTYGCLNRLTICVKDCFSSPIVIARKRVGSKNLTFNLQLLNDQMLKKKISGIHKLVEIESKKYGESTDSGSVVLNMETYTSSSNYATRQPNIEFSV